VRHGRGRKDLVTCYLKINLCCRHEEGQRGGQGLESGFEG
jgi:hypothetical protein